MIKVLLRPLTKWNSIIGATLLVTALGGVVILALSLSLPLAGLADATSRLTLGIFVIVNTALIRIRSQ